MNDAIGRREFGTLDDGSAVLLFTLANRRGMRVSVGTLGGAVNSILCPGRHGQLGDVVLGFDDPLPYLQDSPYIGTLIGRYCNRIARGRFSIGGTVYQLPANDHGHHLHGGPEGFHRRLWEAEAYLEGGEPVLALSRTSPDGEEGYPGTLEVCATYKLTDDNELRIEFHAAADKPTHVNLTQHAYFNLAGGGGILSHRLFIDADYYTPVDAGLIPLGQREKVDGTVFDFRRGNEIGAWIDEEDIQISRAHGYDHNFVLNKPAPGTLEPAARVLEPASGRILEVSTTEPGMQFYSGNFLDGSFSGKGRVFSRRSAFCLEPQHFPDSPNHPDFPSTLLRPGETYRTLSIYRFTTDREM